MEISFDQLLNTFCKGFWELRDAHSRDVYLQHQRSKDPLSKDNKPKNVRLVKEEVNSLERFREIALSEQYFKQEIVLVLGRLMDKTLTVWVSWINFGGYSHDEQTTKEVPHSILRTENETKKWMIDQKLIESRIDAEMYTIQCGVQECPDQRLDISEFATLYEQTNGKDLVLYVIRKVKIIVQAQPEKNTYINADEISVFGDYKEFQRSISVKVFGSQNEDLNLGFLAYIKRDNLLLKCLVADINYAYFRENILFLTQLTIQQLENNPYEQPNQ